MNKSLTAFAFASLVGLVAFSTTSTAQPDALRRCQRALSEDVNPSLMSRDKAWRESRDVCYSIRKTFPRFYKALTQ